MPISGVHHCGTTFHLCSKPSPPSSQTIQETWALHHGHCRESQALRSIHDARDEAFFTLRCASQVKSSFLSQYVVVADTLVRLILNYKQVPFETIWIHGTQIEKVAKEVGAPPTRTNLDGSLGYTTPFIVIESPGKENVIISDSERIARYFDAKDPDASRSLFLKETAVLDAYFIAGIKNILFNIARINMVTWMRVFPPDVAEYFSKSRENVYGIPFDIFVPKDAEALEERWEELEKALNELASLMDKAEEGGCRITPYVSYPEITLAAFLYVTRCVSAGDPNGWERLAKRNGGRWERLLEVPEYRTIESPLERQ